MAQEVPVCGPQGRHDVCAPHVLHFGVEASQQFVPGAHEGWAAQDHVLRGVGFLPAYRAAGRAALRVVALLALPGGRLPDPVSPLGRDGPVAGSQLVDVDRGLPVSSGDGRGELDSFLAHPRLILGSHLAHSWLTWITWLTLFPFLAHSLLT